MCPIQYYRTTHQMPESESLGTFTLATVQSTILGMDSERLILKGLDGLMYWDQQRRLFAVSQLAN